MLKEFIEELLKAEGRAPQYVYTLEECSELIQAITKELRGKGDLSHTKEECIDTIFTAYMLLLDEFPDITYEEIESAILIKCHRALKRLKENGFD